MSSPTIRPCGFPAILLILALITPTACNESGGGGLLAGGGIGGTGISVGEISGFGSVIVNDVDFNTQIAEVVVNGNSIGIGDSIVRSALALGMVVRVEGKYRTDGTGTADRIVFKDNLNGPVTSIETFDSVAKKVVVLDQIVIVDDRTRFQNTDFDSLAIGNVLQVSGWPDGSGIIQATFVAKIADSPDPNDEVMIQGIVTEANIAQRWFRINELRVDLFQITDAVPVTGQMAGVRGFLDNNGMLVAAVISIEDELGIDDADSVEIKGIVSQVSSPADFILGTTAVQTDEATSFKGLEPDDIVPGARLLVKGALTNRRLLADEVIAKDKVTVEGKVEDINSGLGEITLQGLSPLIIRVASFTKIFGDANELDDIRSGQNVKVLGYAVTENELEATQIKMKVKAKDKVKLQGPLTSKNPPLLSIFRVEIDTSEIPEEEFEIDTDDDNPRREFLKRIEVGNTISATGKMEDDEVVWKGIELLPE